MSEFELPPDEPTGNGIYPPDYTSDVGVVRLNIPDCSLDEDGNFIFSDEQIAAFLSLYNGNVKRASAEAILVLATDMALLLKYIKTDDLLVDGVKVATEMRLRAAALKQEADQDDKKEDSFFDLVFPPQNTCQWREEYEQPWSYVPWG